MMIYIVNVLLMFILHHNNVKEKCFFKMFYDILQTIHVNIIYFQNIWQTGIVKHFSDIYIM